MSRGLHAVKASHAGYGGECARQGCIPKGGSPLSSVKASEFVNNAWDFVTGIGRGCGGNSACGLESRVSREDTELGSLAAILEQGVGAMEGAQ